MDNGNGGQGVTKAQVIAMAMVILFQISIVPTPSMLDGPSDRMESSVSNQLETYSLYLTTGNNLSTVQVLTVIILLLKEVVTILLKIQFEP